MSFSRCLLLLSALLLTGLPAGGIAAERSHGMVTKAESSLRGTWYSAEGPVTFQSNGTVKFRGERYFYAAFQRRHDTAQRKSQFERDLLPACRRPAYFDDGWQVDGLFTPTTKEKITASRPGFQQANIFPRF